MGRLFGTDGVRGVANVGLTCELALQIGRAAAEVLSTGRRRPVVVVGMDPRISSDMLANALTAGLCSIGADVIALGVVPTPAVAYLLVKYKADAGVMVSASHNSSEFNGIKIFSGDGYKLPDELEERIETLVLDGHNAALRSCAVGGEIGRVTIAKNACKDYVDHLKSTVSYSLEGMRLAVDCANGSASATAVELFSGLGATCDFLFHEPNGVNINDNCGSTHMEALRRHVLEHGLEAGVAFDGDADRCLMIDGEGNLFDGDYIMAICARDMKQRGKLNKHTVVGTIMTNLGFIKFCEQNDISFIATKVGDRFVLEEMLLEEYDFGGEQSGHVIFRDFATTGDGQLTAIQLLSLLKRQNMQLSEMADILQRFPQRMVNVTVSPEGRLSFYTDPEVKAAIERAKQALGKEGRIVVRLSGTEPLVRIMVEGTSAEQIEQLGDEVAATIRERLDGK